MRARLAVAREPRPPIKAPAAPPDDADTDFDFPRHSWIPQDRLPPVPAIAALVPRSVFDLAIVDAPPVMLKQAEALPTYAATVQPQRGAGESGALRVIGCRYPANRWTPERVEYEERRRAKQRPPRPTKKARTTSKKLRDLIGLQFDDD